MPQEAQSGDYKYRSHQAYSGWGVTLTTHLQSEVENEWNCTSTPPYFFTACTGTTLSLLFLVLFNDDKILKTEVLIIISFTLSRANASWLILLSIWTILLFFFLLVDISYWIKLWPSSSLATYQKQIYYLSIKVFNSLPSHIKNFSDNTKEFKSAYFRSLCTNSFYSLNEYFNLNKECQSMVH